VCVRMKPADEDADQVWHKSPRVFRESLSAWQYPAGSE